VDARAFYGYWSRDPVRCTPAPLPVDLAMGFSAITRKIHESIPGLEVRGGRGGEEGQGRGHGGCTRGGGSGDCKVPVRQSVTPCAPCASP
jgi:hypothetical protein